VADSKVVVLDQAPAGLATKNADTEQLVGVGGANVERQRFQLGGAALAEIARVTNAAPAPADYGLVARVLLYDAAGNPAVLTSYPENTVVAVANGTPMLFKDDAVPNTLRIASSTNPLPVIFSGSSMQIKGGTGNLLTVKGGGAAAVAGDTSTVVALSPNTPLPAGANAIGSVDVTDRAGRLIGIADLVDADTRILGRTKLRDSANLVIDPMPKTGGSVDVIDRVGRALGVVASITAAVDVSDRAARALGVVASITAAVDVSDRAGRALGAVSSAQLPAALGATGGLKVEGVALGIPQTVYERDPGYAHLAIYSEAVAGIIAETAISMQLSRAFGAPAASTSNGAAAGKELVILGIILGWVSTTTTANTARFRLRVNPAGAALISSAIAWTMRIGWESATFIANEEELQPIFFPRPIIIPNPGAVMATIACVAANGTLDVQLIAYERTIT
jgi:hypothetical protein